ncbi:MAG: hypothetical protein AAGJ91_14555 [Pseudomonadota bacterium]
MMFRAALFFLVLALPTKAHHVSEALTRALTIDDVDGHIEVTVTLPATLLYANAANARSGANGEALAPFLRTSAFDGQIVYLVDTAGMAEAPERLAQLLGQMVPLSAAHGDAPVPAAVTAYERVSTTVDGPLHVAEAEIRATFRFSAGASLSLVPIAAMPRLPPDWHMETLILDRRHSPPVNHRRIGPLLSPIPLPAP